MTNVNATVTDLVGPSGAVISKSNYTLYREHYVYVPTASYDYGTGNRSLGAGWYPDGLIPFVNPATGADIAGASLDAVPFSLASGKNQPLWVDLFVPRTAVAGQYTGSLTVTSNQGTAVVPIFLKVRNFTLPLKPSLNSSFGLKAPYDSDISVQQMFLQHRIMSQYIKSSHSRTLIDQYGLSMTALLFNSGATVGNCSMTPAPTVSALQSAASRYPSDIAKYVYSADEVDACTSLIPNLKAWGYAIHQAGYKNLVTMMPNPLLYDDGSGTGRSAVDIWVVAAKTYNIAGPRIGEAIARGDQVWSYTTLAPDSYSPRWQIDFAPINFRIQPGFLSQSLGLTGILYYRTTGWTSSPWTNVQTFVSGSYQFAGDGMLVYPGTQVGLTTLVPSMRLKWLREGIEDYEYVQVLKNMGRADWALQTARTAGSNWTNWTRDNNLLASVRTQIADEIELGGGGSPAPPPPPPPPPPTSGGLAAPTSPSPANGAINVPLATTLSWQAVSGATSYDIYAGTSATNLPKLLTLTTTSVPAGLSKSTTYYWKIVAKNSTNSTSSAVWNFRSQ